MKAGGIRSIVCAVDFSPQSHAALQTAVQIAEDSGGHVTALCVDDPLIGAGTAASGYDLAALRKSTQAQLTRLMERVTKPNRVAASRE